MKNVNVLVLLLLIVLGFSGCSKDDEPGTGKAAKYQVVITQSGDYQNYIKSVVIAANGSPLFDDIAKQSLSKTVFSDEDLGKAIFSVSTEQKTIQFSVAGGAADRDDEVTNNPMQWEVVVNKDGKEIDRQIFVFGDGQKPSVPIKLYYD